jgi:hypothetical protein
VWQVLDGCLTGVEREAAPGSLRVKKRGCATCVGLSSVPNRPTVIASSAGPWRSRNARQSYPPTLPRPPSSRILRSALYIHPRRVPPTIAPVSTRPAAHTTPPSADPRHPLELTVGHQRWCDSPRTATTIAYCHTDQTRRRQFPSARGAKRTPPAARGSPRRNSQRRPSSRAPRRRRSESRISH